VDVLPEIKKTYIDTGKVKLVFREYPLDQRALAVFMLTRCIPEDKYFATVDLVFRRQKAWNGENAKAELLKITKMSGMSEAEFDACLKREDLAKAIFETGKTAREEFGVKGTPTFFVNGKLVDGHKDASAVTAAIEAALAAK
jgi:protein-disulfide isomerase